MTTSFYQYFQDSSPFQAKVLLQFLAKFGKFRLTEMRLLCKVLVLWLFIVPQHKPYKRYFKYWRQNIKQVCMMKFVSG